MNSNAITLRVMNQPKEHHTECDGNKQKKRLFFDGRRSVKKSRRGCFKMYVDFVLDQTHDSDANSLPSSLSCSASA